MLTNIWGKSFFFFLRSDFDAGWEGVDNGGGEYVGGFGNSSGNMMTGRSGMVGGTAMRSRIAPGGAGKAPPSLLGGPPSLLNTDAEREWDDPDRGEFVGGGGDDNFVGGGDPKFLPTGRPGAGKAVFFIRNS